jgi:tetratricopeptide (TPR) repeat protein
LARILLWQGELDQARSNYEQALSLAESANASSEEREIRYALAELAIEEQRSANARETLRWLQAELKRVQNVDVELECLILQTRLELLDKQKNSALTTAIRAQSVSGSDNRFDLKMSAAGILVKAAAASQKWKQADQVIGSALLEASQSGCLACELRARLSVCELKDQENAFDASRCFVNLEQAAASKGFGRIAKDAAARLRPPTS